MKTKKFSFLCTFNQTMIKLFLKENIRLVIEGEAKSSCRSWLSPHIMSTPIVEPNTFTHMPESTLFSSKGLRIWPLFQPEKKGSDSLRGGGGMGWHKSAHDGWEGLKEDCFMAFGEGKHEMEGGEVHVHCALCRLLSHQARQIYPHDWRTRRSKGCWSKVEDTSASITDLCTRTMTTFFSVSELIPWETSRPSNVKPTFFKDRLLSFSF